jgi:hypothetical protein
MVDMLVKLESTSTLTFQGLPNKVTAANGGLMMHSLCHAHSRAFTRIHAHYAHSRACVVASCIKFRAIDACRLRTQLCAWLLQPTSPLARAHMLCM